MSKRKIVKDGSDGLPPVINVTGHSGRSIFIGIGLPPGPPVIADRQPGEDTGQQEKPRRPLPPRP